MVCGTVSRYLAREVVGKGRAAVAGLPSSAVVGRDADRLGRRGRLERIVVHRELTGVEPLGAPTETRLSHVAQLVDQQADLLLESTDALRILGSASLCKLALRLQLLEERFDRRRIRHA